MAVDDLPSDQMEAIVEMVGRCESYADELFEGESYFTSVTKFDDGDFRVATRRGKGQHGVNDSRDDDYRQDYEIITYKHTDGSVVYADRTRYIDAKFTETHNRKVLE